MRPPAVTLPCLACGARHVIRSLAVRGRRFRTRCRRCGEVIVARCDSAYQVVVGEVDDPAEPLDLDRDDDPPQWYLVLGGKPHGPVTRAQIREGLFSGRFTPRTYAWRPGQANWHRLRDMVELSMDETHEAEIGREPSMEDLEVEPTRLHRGHWEDLQPRAGAPDLAGWDRPDSDAATLYADAARQPGAAKMDPEWKPEISAPVRLPEADVDVVSGSWSAPARGPAALPPPASLARAMAETVAAPAGQGGPASVARRQDSLAPPEAGAMVQQQVQEQGTLLPWIPDRPLQPVANGPPAPLLMMPPTPFWTTRRIIGALAGGGALVVAGLVTALVLTLRPSAPPAIPTAPVPAAPAAAAPAAPAPAAPAAPAAAAPAAPAVARPAAPSAADRQAKATKARAEKERAEKERAEKERAEKERAEKERAEKERAAKARAEKAPVPETRAQRRPAARSNRSTRAPSRPARPAASREAPSPAAVPVDPDAILAAATRATRVKAEGPRTLTRPQIQRGMARLKPWLQGCLDKYPGEGRLTLDVHITPAGRATGRARPPFAKTRLGSCVVGGLVRLKFPKFSGPPIDIVYPFELPEAQR